MSRQPDPFLRGIFPALVTPLKPDGSVHVRSLEQLVERMYDKDADGLYLCGSTGEGLRMQPDARQLVAEVVKSLSPKGKQVIVHIGAGTLEQTLELARRASRLGVTAISSLPLAGMQAAELPGFYRSIAVSAGLPVVAYYFPGHTGYSLTFEQLAELGRTPGVEGVKFTDYDLYALSRLNDAGLRILNGRDEILVAGLIMGAVGGIGSLYNIIPRRFVELFRLATEARWEEARRLQITITRFITMMLSFPLLPAIKQALGWTGIDCGHTLGSPSELTADQKQRLRTELDRYQDLLAP
jgi:N-acetylneuraminate lyase